MALEQIRLAKNPSGAAGWLALLARAALLCGLLAGGVTDAQAQQPAATLETSVKAASIYKFLSYVEWPAASFPSAETPFVIAVLGNDELADALEHITSGRQVNQRGLSVRRLRAGEAAGGALHVLVIGSRVGEPLPQLLGSVPQKGVLTITDAKGALNAGSVINFRLQDGRVRFEVSLLAAEKNNLKISSRMLPIAIAVQAAGAP